MYLAQQTSSLYLLHLLSIFVVIQVFGFGPNAAHQEEQYSTILYHVVLLYLGTYVNVYTWYVIK